MYYEHIHKILDMLVKVGLIDKKTADDKKQELYEEGLYELEHTRI